MAEIFVGRNVVLEFAYASADTKPEDIVWHRLGIANPTRKRKPVKARIIKKAAKKAAADPANKPWIAVDVIPYYD